MNDEGVGVFQMNNSWWGNSSVASGALTLHTLNKALSQMMQYSLITPRQATKLLGYKDIEWDLAIDDALEMIRA